MKYQKPLIIEDNVLGKLELNRDFEYLEGNISWNGESVSLSLEIDMEDEATWDIARNNAYKLIVNSETWDKSMREFAAKNLTNLANDWQANDESEDNAPITEKDFSERITLSHLSIFHDDGGTFTAYYNDDDLFWGHTIKIYGSVKNGFKFANIVG